MIEIIETDLVSALCPHCEEEVTRLIAQRVRSALGVRYLYCCGECRKVLGVSHRKGFWMG